jgi:hypothetical protein
MLKDDTANITTEKMNKNANASAKSKELQRNPQTNAQLHHICFYPNHKKIRIEC